MSAIGEGAGANLPDAALPATFGAMPDPASPPFLTLLSKATGAPKGAAAGRSCAPLLLALPILGGCALVDQRTFDPNADRAPKPYIPPAKVVPPAPPLALIRLPASAETWQPPLTDIVQKALALKPDALFRVEAHLPAAATPDAQAAAIAGEGAREAAAVADAVVAAGASTAQVDIAAVSDPAIHAPDVRVTVR